MKVENRELVPWEELDPTLQEEAIESEPFLQLFGFVPSNRDELLDLFVKTCEANIAEVDVIVKYLKEQI